jgi:2-polyprenyl-6-methoxyphenol hydroxylase-like FAD-dependent oxidoreductase
MDEIPQVFSCRCCIVGGGPAGMMLGFLLGRAGVDTIVLEKRGFSARFSRRSIPRPSKRLGSNLALRARRDRGAPAGSQNMLGAEMQINLVDTAFECGAQTHIVSA